jgi:mycothiol synthase
VEDRGRVAGAALVISEDLEGRRNDACLDFLYVLPDARRRGVATALLDAVVTRARKDGRTRLSCSGPAGDPAAGGFARSCKAEPELVELQNRAATAGLDPDLLRMWVDRSQERAGEYSLIGIDGALPGELRPAFARLTQVMNTAPHGPNLEDLIMSAEDLEECQRAFGEQGYQRWTVIARHDPTGELAGFTELLISPFRPWIAFQWDTGVDPAHRNVGLGRWLKATNALRLLEELPEVDEIETWNAKSNASMLGINRAMGFRTVAEWQSWEMAI